MFNFLNIRVDGLSFVIGLITGTLFWFLLNQLKNYFPRLQSALKKLIQQIRDRNYAGVDLALRQEALKRAEKAHLAASLFPLDEILVLPKLIAPPAVIDPAQEQHNDDLSSSIFPYLPDFPQLPSQYPVEQLTLAEALQHDANLVLVGALGSGKTVALAHLVTQLVRRDSTLGIQQGRVPFFLHILDILPADTSLPFDFITCLTKIYTPRIPILAQNRLKAFLKNVLADGRALLALDGLDELPGGEYQKSVSLISQILKEYPQLRIVTTSSAKSLGGLIESGFQVVTLASWNYVERSSFIRTWARVWTDQIVPEIKKKSDLEMVDPVFLTNWVAPERVDLTPMEWTLIVWAAFSGEGAEISPIGALDTMIARIIPDSRYLQPIQKVARELVANQKACLRPDDLDQLLKRSSLAQIQLFDPGTTPAEAKTPPPQTKASKEPPSIPVQWFSILSQTGLVEEYPGRALRFLHPVITAYLAASSCPTDEIREWFANLDFWEVKLLAMGYYFAKFPGQQSIPDDWIRGNPPFYHQPLAISHWLRFTPPNHPVRPKVMKRLADGFLDGSLLPSTRIRFASAIVFANDPSGAVLFRQMLASPKPSIRAISALMTGALKDTKAINQLTVLLTDPDNDARRNACFALGAIQSNVTYEILTECLSAEDEILRQVSAEALASDPSQGHAILKEAAKSENLLTRRSAVFGLMHIHEDWAKEILQEIAIQDGQWVVRNAASEALDTLQKPNPHVPQSPMPPSETPWLFTFANKLGKGIPTGDLAIDILLEALKSGSSEEKIAALDHLRMIPNDNIYQATYDLAVTSSTPTVVSDAAQLALWYMDINRPSKPKVNRAAFTG